MATKLKLHRKDGGVIKRDVATRWTAKLAKGGFTPVVNVFLEHYSRLKPPLTTPEAMLVVHLMSYKWGDQMPWPSFKSLGKRMGISATAVRNHARSLDTRKKYLVRHKRVGQPNLFDLAPLFAALEKAQAIEVDRKTGEHKNLQRVGA